MTAMNGVRAMQCDLQLGDRVTVAAKVENTILLDRVGVVRGIKQTGRAIEVWVKYPKFKRLVKVNQRFVDFAGPVESRLKSRS